MFASVHRGWSARVVLACAFVLWAAGAGVSSAAPPSGAPTSQASGSGHVRKATRATFGLAPASARAIDSRPYFAYRLLPRMKYGDQVAVLNYSNHPVTLQVASVDLINSATGDLDAGLTHAGAKDAGRWIQLHGPNSVRVPAAAGAKGPGMRLIPFAIALPADASPGDHAGAIVATLSSTGHGGHANIRLNQRVATRVIVRVPGPLKPGLAVTALTASYRQDVNPVGRGSARVSYKITNTGNVILGANQTAALSGWFGSHADVPAADTPQIPLLLPGRSATVSFVVHRVFPAVVEHVSVDLHPIVQTTDRTTVHLATVSASARFWAISWVLVAIVAAVMLLALGTWWWRRRRRRRVTASPSPDGDQLVRTG